MATLPPDRPAVNRAPFRPLIAPPAVTHWTDEAGAVHVLLSGRRKADAYQLIQLATDFAGAAFRWFRAGGECYDVLASGTDSSCTCAGYCYSGGCKHLHATFALLEAGALAAAPVRGDAYEGDLP